MTNDNQNITVFISEEYGYRYWSWEPEMTKEQFSNWWKNLTDSDIIKYYFNIKALPGVMTETTPDSYNAESDIYCHFHDVDDSYIQVDGEQIPHNRTTRRDWKDHWVDYQIKNNSPTQNL